MNITTLPCGCVCWTDDELDAFVIEPHEPDCKFYRFALQEAERQGKPITKVEIA